MADMTDQHAGRVRVLGLLTIIAGAILAVAGVGTYVTVSLTLADQKITVSEDASAFAGQTVTQPWQAYVQASLYTSVVAFGVALMAVGIGVVFILMVWALRTLGARPSFQPGESVT